MATTSGTVGVPLKEVDAASLIDHAFLMCGKLSSTVGGELLQRARERLQMMLWALSNDGVNLWAIRKTIFNLTPNRTVLPMAAGTVDVINALYRRLNAQAGVLFSAAGIQGVTLTAEQVVQNVSGTFAAAGTATLIVEYSLDNITWVKLLQMNPAAVDVGSSFAIDIDNSAQAKYWRIRDASGILPAIGTDLAFRTIQEELPMSKLNRDDYQTLPRKENSGGTALQFWYDKQIDSQLWIWPRPRTAGRQIVVWEHSLIEDVGAFNNRLAIPARWYESVVSQLAERVALMIPPTELPPGRLAEIKTQSAEDKRRAARGENDGSSSRFVPNIRAYTR